MFKDSVHGKLSPELIDLQLKVKSTRVKKIPKCKKKNCICDTDENHSLKSMRALKLCRKLNNNNICWLIFSLTQISPNCSYNFVFPLSILLVTPANFFCTNNGQIQPGLNYFCWKFICNPYLPHLLWQLTFQLPGFAIKIVY